MTDQPTDVEANARETERLDLLGVAAADVLAPSVRALCVMDAKGEPVVVGSCVLLWHRGVRYVLTAAHVVEQHPADMLFLAAAPRLVPLPPPYFLRQLDPGQAREDDLFDYAFRPVTAAEAAELEGCRFLTASRVADKDAASFDEPRSAYLAVGHPPDRSEHRAGSGTTVGEHEPRAGFIDSRENYAQLGLHPQAHVLMRFPYAEREGPTSEESTQAGKGMAGGGVFRFPAFEQRGAIAPPTLAGIVIEARLSEQAIVGVRLGVVLAAIDNARAAG